MHRIYVPITVDYSKKNKSMTIPDQSMSIAEIIKRFVRGVPVDVIQRQGVYVDQNDHDLEAMSRLDFADKAFMADELRQNAQAIEADLVGKERSKRATKQKEAEAAKASAAASGIGSLDNTMPVDTKQSTK
jgi:hypothetical protein